MAKTQQDEVISSQDMMDDAPTRSKKGTYLKPVPPLKLFMPVKERWYKLLFLPWRPGKTHPRHGQQNWVTNRFFDTHSMVGPNEEKFCCLQNLCGKTCYCCIDFNERKKRCPRGDKKAWETISPLQAKHREMFFVNDIDGEPNNLQVWEESTSFFGDYFREKISYKAAYRNFADFKLGLIVAVKGRPKMIGSYEALEFPTIELEERPGPISKFLVEAAGKYCLDDFLIEVPGEKLKKLVLSTGGIKAPPTEQAAPASNSTTSRTASSFATEVEEVDVPVEGDQEVVDELPAEECVSIAEEEQGVFSEFPEEEVPTSDTEVTNEEPGYTDEIVAEEADPGFEEVEEAPPPPPPPPVRRPAAPAQAARPAVKPATAALATRPAAAKPAAAPVTRPVTKPPQKK